MGRVYFRKAFWVETVSVRISGTPYFVSRSGRLLFVRDIFAVRAVSHNYGASHVR